jgi:heat shock protein HslJ
MAVDGSARPPLADLSGTAWQLHEIQSMDDRVTRPAEGRPHTMSFGIDGSVTVQADCNRATGGLAVFNPPSLQFDQFAATHALCGPDSIGEILLRELGWVRSYVYSDGRLHLATMADGSILSFDALDSPAVTARVLDLSLVINDADALRGIALSRLLDDYAARNALEASEAAVDAYIADMDQHMRADLGDDYESGESLPLDEQAAMDEMRRSMAASMIRSWEINRSLYRTYGGRVIYQQFGPEPLDAYVMFLREAQRDGRFQINDRALEAAFWAFFQDEQRHDFYPEAEAVDAFAQPPWEAAGN